MFNLALRWFRRETDIEVVRAEIQEMEADFQNLETNSTHVMIKEIHRGKKSLTSSPILDCPS